MANSFFNFVTRFISGTTVKAGPINDRLTEVQSGFTSVETVVKSALKFAGYSTSTPITATPNSFIQLNASGLPVASATVGFSPNLGGYRIQNVGNAAIGTDATSYGQMTAYVATIAFGSPNVLTVPSFLGNGLKPLRLNVSETALEFGTQFSSPPTDDLAVLTSTAAGAVWLREQPNWVYGPNEWKGLSFGATVEYGTGPYSSQLCLRSDTSASPRMVYSSIATNGATSLNAMALRQGSYACSFSMVNSSVAGAGGIQVVVRWYDAVGTLVATDFQNFPADGTQWRRYSFSGNRSGVSAAGFTVIISELVGQQGDLYVADLKVEHGTTATNYNAESTIERANVFSKAFEFIRTIVGVTRTTFFKLLNGSTVLTGDRQTGIILETMLAGVVDGISILGDKNNSLLIGAASIRTNKLLGYSNVYDNGSTGAAKTVDWPNNGAKQKATLNGNATITLIALDSTIVVDGLRLMLQKDATGTTFTPTFNSAATIKWKGNVVPEPLTIANQEMEVIFWWDGARFVGSWAKI